MDAATSVTRVVYLMGAGASQGCVTSVNSPHGILMQDFGELLCTEIRELLNNEYVGDQSLEYLVNSVIDPSVDFEQIITFLSNAPSSRHRKFAEEMRVAFEKLLRRRLDLIREETQGDVFRLYKVLIDMHNIEQSPEVLQGIITTNYDEYIESAVKELGQDPVDFGVRVEPSCDSAGSIRLLKLHGSLGWQDTLPVARGQAGDDTLWIPPGIEKSKQSYPFNVIWGLAREILSCDVLRVIGCQLGTNDWDLISLLFSMQHVSSTERPRIEIVDAPSHVERLKLTYKYLELSSIFEIKEIGGRMLTELTGRESEAISALEEEERQQMLDRVGPSHNWFELWLKAKVESLFIDFGSVSTKTGVVDEFLTV